VIILTKTKYKDKHKASSKNKVNNKKKGLIIGLAFIGIILTVSVIWIVSIKLYPGDSKSDVDNASNNSGIETINEEEKTDDSIVDEASDGDVKQVLPSNNIETKEGLTQAEENLPKSEEPSQNRKQAPQG
jgi:cytoskeletal protein RodZ